MNPITMDNLAIMFSELTGVLYIVRTDKNWEVLDKRAFTKKELELVKNAIK